MALAHEQVALMSDEERKELGDNPDAMLERQISAPSCRRGSVTS